LDFLERSPRRLKAGESRRKKDDRDADEELEEVVDDDAESDMDAPESDQTVVERERLLRFFDVTGTSASVESAHMVGVRIGYAAAGAAASCRRHAADGAGAGSRGGGGSSASESSMIRDTHSSSSASWA
jgi:hypothetical protein